MPPRGDGCNPPRIRRLEPEFPRESEKEGIQGSEGPGPMEPGPGGTTRARPRRVSPVSLAGKIARNSRYSRVWRVQPVAGDVAPSTMAIASWRNPDRVCPAVLPGKMIITPRPVRRAIAGSLPPVRRRSAATA